MPAQPVVTVVSAHSAAETERGLLEALSSTGLQVGARIDHCAKVVFDIPSTLLLLIGNPRASIPLMQRQRTIALDLPLKVLIWEEAGETRVSSRCSRDCVASP
jgi:uncharacterized protein (DUF302 family)